MALKHCPFTAAHTVRQNHILFIILRHERIYTVARHFAEISAYLSYRNICGKFCAWHKFHKSVRTVTLIAHRCFDNVFKHVFNLPDFRTLRRSEIYLHFSVTAFNNAYFKCHTSDFVKLGNKCFLQILSERKAGTYIFRHCVHKAWHFFILSCNQVTACNRLTRPYKVFLIQFIDVIKLHNEQIRSQAFILKAVRYWCKLQYPPCFNRIKQQHYTAVCACKVGLPAFNRIRTPLAHSVRNLIKKWGNIFIIWFQSFLRSIWKTLLQALKCLCRFFKLHRQILFNSYVRTHRFKL